jgi:hypothetical protein
MVSVVGKVVLRKRCSSLLAWVELEGGRSVYAWV